MTELSFPVAWRFKLIALATAELEAPVLAVLAAHHTEAPPPSPLRLSAQGSYRTWALDVTFRDRRHMEELSTALAALPGVKQIL